MPKEKAIEIVCNYFGCSRHKAKKYLKGLSPYDGEEVREMNRWLQKQAKLCAQ